MDIIRINNLRVQAIVGCNAHERTKVQPLRITVSIVFDTWNAAATDDLRNTINYDDLAKRITAMVEQSEFMLIETMAQHVADIVLMDERVLEVTVDIVKPEAMENADSAEVIITRSRNNE